MKRIGLLILALVLSTLSISSRANATNSLDLSRYQSETLEEAFKAENIDFDFSTSPYDETNTTNKTILYLFRKNGCENCQSFLQFIARDLLPRYADRLIVKSYEVSENNRINMSLLSRLADFYDQQPENDTYSTPAVIIGTTYSSGYVDTARQAEIKSVLDNHDTFDPVKSINQGTTNLMQGAQTTFTSGQAKLLSDTGLNSQFHLVATPINRAQVSLRDYTYVSALDLSLYNYTTKINLLNGKYTITLPVTKNYQSYRVAHLDASGKITEEFIPTVEKSTITFTTTHLSEYVIYGRSQKPIDANTTPDQKPTVPIITEIYPTVSEIQPKNTSTNTDATQKKSTPTVPNAGDSTLSRQATLNYPTILTTGLTFLAISAICYRKVNQNLIKKSTKR